LEEASVQAKYGQFKESSKAVSIQPQLRLHEMRAETYNGLVRLLKPGCRTIVLLVDAQSKLKLLPSFHRAVWPYRYKSLIYSIK
jgi:DnaJ family protein C protein 16